VQFILICEVKLSARVQITTHRSLTNWKAEINKQRQC